MVILYGLFHFRRLPDAHIPGLTVLSVCGSLANKLHSFYYRFLLHVYQLLGKVGFGRLGSFKGLVWPFHPFTNPHALGKVRF